MPYKIQAENSRGQMITATIQDEANGCPPCLGLWGDRHPGEIAAKALSWWPRATLN